MKINLSLLVLALALVGCNEAPEPRSASTPAAATTMTMNPYGEIDGKPVTEYTLSNANGCTLKVLDYGCIVTELHVPNKAGEMTDIALGSVDLATYQTNSPYFGAMVGRCANRIANATFSIDGTEYKLAANNGEHSLHGGTVGFDKVIWTAEPQGANAIAFTHTSKDGDEGFPGNLSAKVIYTLTDDNEFTIKTTATTDKATVCNIAHHSYWNLDGHDAGTHYDHKLTLHADTYTIADETLIPTGELKDVAGGPLDFRKAKTIGQDLKAVGADPAGYDHNFVVKGDPASLRIAAVAEAASSGIIMTVEADKPGIQFYTGNFMNGHPGKGGAVYEQHEGFCLETQDFPDSINKEGTAGWASVILRPGETYSHTMVHRFTVAK